MLLGFFYLSHVCCLVSFFSSFVNPSGGSLESVIGHDGCLSEDVVRRFGWDLVKGLKHIHELGIIFSDLTPAKVCIHLCVYVELINKQNYHMNISSLFVAHRSYWMAVVF